MSWPGLALCRHATRMRGPVTARRSVTGAQVPPISENFSPASAAAPPLTHAAFADEFDDSKCSKNLPDDVYLEVWALVRLLFGPCRPSAVAGLVVAVGVDPVKRVIARRPLSHILKECLEAVAPALAHCDAATAITMIIGRVGVKTPLLHGLPRLESRGSLAIRTMAVNSVDHWKMPTDPGGCQPGSV